MNPLTFDSKLEELYAILAELTYSQTFLPMLKQLFQERNSPIPLEKIIQQWENDNFQHLPQLQILSGKALKGANATYTGRSNTLYLSAEIVKTIDDSLERVKSILLEGIRDCVEYHFHQRAFTNQF